MNITELNEQTYARANLVSGKIGIPSRNLNRITKHGWKIKLEWQMKKLQYEGKWIRKNTSEWKKKII